MAIRSLEELRLACESLTVKLLYSMPGEGRRTPRAEFRLDNLPEWYPCPEPECAQGGFRLLQLVGQLVEDRRQRIESGGTSEVVLNEEIQTGCVGTIQREGKDWEKCPRTITVQVEGVVTRPSASAS